MYFISLLHIMAMAMILGVIYLILKPRTTTEDISKPRTTIGRKVSIAILCVLLFPTLISLILSMFFSPLFLTIALLHGLLFIVLRRIRIARLWTPSLTRWFWGCTIFIFAYLYFSLPDFMWKPFEDVMGPRGQGSFDSFIMQHFYSSFVALLFSPYIALAFVTIVCLFQKLFKKLSGQKEPA